MRQGQRIEVRLGSSVMSRDALVEYHRFGGITGKSDRLVIQDSGRAHLTQRNDQEIDGQISEGLMSRIRAGLSQIQGAKTKSSTGVDRFDYRIVYGGGSYEFSDPVTDAALREIVDLLSNAIDECRKQR